MNCKEKEKKERKNATETETEMDFPWYSPEIPLSPKEGTISW